MAERILAGKVGPSDHVVYNCYRLRVRPVMIGEQTPLKKWHLHHVEIGRTDRSPAGIVQVASVIRLAFDLDFLIPASIRRQFRR